MIVSVINQLLVAYTIQSAMGWVSGGAKTSSAGQSFAVPSYRPQGFDVGGLPGTAASTSQPVSFTAGSSSSPKSQPAASAWLIFIG
jgi:hypothetical protein